MDSIKGGHNGTRQIQKNDRGKKQMQEVCIKILEKNQAVIERNGKG